MKSSYPVGSRPQGPSGTVRAQPLLLPKLKKLLSKPLICFVLYFWIKTVRFLLIVNLNLLSPNIDMQILQTDLHIFLIKLVERICYMTKVLSL